MGADTERDKEMRDGLDCTDEGVRWERSYIYSRRTRSVPVRGVFGFRKAFREMELLAL